MTDLIARAAILHGQRDRLIRQIAACDVDHLRRLLDDARAEIAELRASLVERCAQIDRLEDENRELRAIVVQIERFPPPASASRGRGCLTPEACAGGGDGAA